MRVISALALAVSLSVNCFSKIVIFRRSCEIGVGLGLGLGLIRVDKG